jgi:regulatory protein
MIDAAMLEDWALSYLARYASTAENLRQMLRRRVRRRLGSDAAFQAEAGGGEPLIEALIVRCRAAGLVDDAAYAANRAHRGVARGRSLRRIAAELARQGVGAADAAAAIATLHDGTADPDLAAAVAFVKRRRIGPFRAAPAQRERDLAALARAGFDRRTAEAVLACSDEAAVSALLARGGPGG